MYVCMHVWVCARVCAYVCVCAWTEKQGRSNFFDPTRDPCITTSPPQLSQLVVPTCSNLLFVRSSEKSSRFPEKFPSRKCRFPFPFPFPIILSFPLLPESGDTIILQRLATPLPFIPSNWINREPSALVAGELVASASSATPFRGGLGWCTRSSTCTRSADGSRYEFSGKQGASFHFQERNSIGKNWSDKREKKCLLP